MSAPPSVHPPRVYARIPYFQYTDRGRRKASLQKGCVCAGDKDGGMKPLEGNQVKSFTYRTGRNDYSGSRRYVKEVRKCKSLKVGSINLLAMDFRLSCCR